MIEKNVFSNILQQVNRIFRLIPNKLVYIHVFDGSNEYWISTQLVHRLSSSACSVKIPEIFHKHHQRCSVLVLIITNSAISLSKLYWSIFRAHQLYRNWFRWIWKHCSVMFSGKNYKMYSYFVECQLNRLHSALYSLEYLSPYQWQFHFSECVSLSLCSFSPFTFVCGYFILNKHLPLIQHHL